MFKIGNEEPILFVQHKQINRKTVRFNSK